jgi:hypothetical protein
LSIDASSQKKERTGTCEGVVRTWSAQASRPLQVPGPHGRTARSTVVQLTFAALTVLAPREDQALQQRADEHVGYSGVGRADSSRRRAVGMDSGDLGVHDDARAGMPSASAGMSIAGSEKTTTSVSKLAVVSCERQVQRADRGPNGRLPGPKE